MRLSSAIATGLFGASFFVNSPVINAQKTVSAPITEQLSKAIETPIISPEVQAAIVKEVIFQFYEKEMDEDDKFSVKERQFLEEKFTLYFTAHPLYNIENGKAKLLFSESYANHMAREFMPYFVSKLSWIYRAGIAIIGEEKARGYLKDKIKDKDLEDAQKMFIEKIFPVLLKFDRQMKKEYIQQGGTGYISPTMKEYFQMIDKTFHNPSFRQRFQKLKNAEVSIHDWREK
ncbi:hypothetical protein AGMMS50249_1430 [candidate division SR1 bacterium]|nr:hypothetical protein AGMMS50249_1430 [candidate division SR1 bacterium]